MRCLFVFGFVVLFTSCSASPQIEEAAENQPFSQSTFRDTDGDGLPDTRIPTRSPAKFEPQSTYADEDGDGLPDRRLPPPRK